MANQARGPLSPSLGVAAGDDQPWQEGVRREHARHALRPGAIQGPWPRPGTPTLTLHLNSGPNPYPNPNPSRSLNPTLDPDPDPNLDQGEKATIGKEYEHSPEPYDLARQFERAERQFKKELLADKKPYRTMGHSLDFFDGQKRYTILDPLTRTQT